MAMCRWLLVWLASPSLPFVAFGLRGLPEFDCEDEPGHSFRLLVQQHAERGFPMDDEITKAALSFYGYYQQTFGKDWMLVGTAVVTGSDEVKNGGDQLRRACYFGAINALAIIAHQFWKVDHAYAYSALKQAVLMLHYDRFDFILSSAWPWTSYFLYKNLKTSKEEEFQVPSPPWKGGADRRERNIMPPATFAPLCTTLSAAPVKWSEVRHSRQSLNVFAVDLHSSTTVGLLYTLSHVVPIKLDVEYHTLDPRCNWASDEHRKYWCQVSAGGDTRVKELFNFDVDSDQALEAIADNIDDFKRQFLEVLKDKLSKVDLFLCTVLPIWCLLYEDLRATVFGYLPGLTTWHVPLEKRHHVLSRFKAFQARPDVFLAFMHPYTAELHAWHTSGQRFPVLSNSGVDRDLPSQGFLTTHLDQVVVGHRPSLEYWKVLKRFQDANADLMSFRFMSAHHDLHYPALNTLVGYRAFVYWMYADNSMLLHEVYSCALPMWVPADMWRWTSHGGNLGPKYVMLDGLPETPAGHSYPPLLRDHRMMDIDVALYWSGYNEAVRLPHLGRFQSIPDLIEQLERVSPAELADISTRMAEWTRLRFAQQCQFWLDALGHALASQELAD